MVIFLIAIGCGILAYIGAWVKADSDIKTQWSHDGPGRIADRLRSRNRTWLGVSFAIFVGLALLEAFIPDVHYLLEDLQYVIGSQPLGMLTLGSGGGISWALYLLTLFAIALGILFGAKTACNAHGTTRGIALGQLI
ncbi:hypothetical protein [Salisaeta longa]|uniref:hypothetical protein n=1 Tax=Salisaeta longa TaxID=503170 RepID=UPI0003B3B5A9|nr:hypothetical protein [Salisaeta longa]